MNIIEQVKEAQELADVGNLSTRRTQDILSEMLGYLLGEEERAIDRVMKTLTYSELEAAKNLMLRLDGFSGLVVTSAAADMAGIPRSTFVNALSKLESAGLLESHSLGRGGTMIKLLVTSLKSRLLASR